MLRTVLKPRWLALLVVVIAVDVAFVILGLWQLSVAKDEGRKEMLANAHNLAPVPLDEVVGPHQPFAPEFSNRPVIVEGSYLPEQQVVIEDRLLDDRNGVWIVTPLRTARTGALVPVLRGFVPADSPAAAGRGTPPTPNAGPVRIVGTLGPTESRDTLTTALPDGRYRRLDLSRLVNIWPGELYNVVVLAADEQPDLSPGVNRVPPPELPSGMTGRNLAYALQWWIFALFASFMWWRMVREDYRLDQAYQEYADGLPDGYASDDQPSDDQPNARQRSMSAP